MANTNMDFLTSSNYNDFEADGDLSNVSKSTSIKPKAQNSSTILNMNTHPTSSSSSSNNNPDYISTLDEPVSVTISRDLKAIAYKFAHVFFPKQSTLLLKDWDLWGPVSLCVILSISLQGNTNVDSNAPEFASVFALIIVGAVLVTLNTKLLSGKISFFQSICVLGYCLLPLVLVSLLNDFIVLISGHGSVTSFVIRFLIVVFSCVWSVFASTAFLAADTINLVDRKSLAIYPIFLFYFVISWLIILDSN
jgi:hypothetical protein